MFEVAVVHSIDPDEKESVQELITAGKSKLAKTRPQIGILFISEYLSPQLFLAPLLEAFPGIELIGTSTDGEISSETGWHENSAVLVLLASDSIKFKTTACRNLSEDTTNSITQGLHEIGALDETPDLILTFPESLTVGGDAVIESLQQRFGKHVSIFGGLSADQWKFSNTFQIYNEEIIHDSAPLLLCYGKISISFGMASGWEPIGNKGIVTSADGNVVRTINNATTLDFYNEYIGGWPENFGEYPLAVNQNDSIVLRAPLLNHEDGSITFAGNVKQGSTVQITSSKRENIIKAAQESCKQAVNDFKGQPKLSLLTSCTARHYVLGTHTIKEYQAAVEIMPDNIQIAGFYSFGEISPDNNQLTMSRLHNETFVCLMLGEKV